MTPKPHIEIFDFDITITYQDVEGEFRGSSTRTAITTPTYEISYGSSNLGMLTTINLLKLGTRLEVKLIGVEYRKQVKEWIEKNTVTKEAFKLGFGVLTYTHFKKLIKRITEESYQKGFTNGKEYVQNGICELLEV